MKNKRSEDWKKIWNRKSDISNLENLKSSNLHKIDGWDNLTEKEYEEIIHSLISGDELEIKKKNKTIQVAEIGCGSGAFLHSIIKKYKLQNENVWGVDYSEKMIDLAKNILPNCHFENLDITDDFKSWKLKLKDNSFDIIFSYGVLFYLNSETEVLKCLENMTKFLSPTGSILIGEVNDFNKKQDYLNIRKKTHTKPSDHLFLKKATFVEFCKKNNFDLKFKVLPSWYSASNYRYHVVMKRKEEN